jgi:hypothetical protein
MSILLRADMKLFECQNCGQPLYFENTRCESCGLRLGYLPAHETVTALRSQADAYEALAVPGERYHLCANAAYEACNWLVDAETSQTFCAACRHNRTIPDLSWPGNLLQWRRIELAKRRLFYTILKLRLPLTLRPRDPNGLMFDFLAPGADEGAVMTGHAGGLITINLAEADDAERERMRSAMGEPYRTLLGHFRHEIAHYYWDHLIADDADVLADFRALFGDERVDYGEALQRHYAEGAPPDWSQSFVTAYASTHPWEDFAETWAHYFHMVDTLETARAFGLKVRPRIANSEDLATEIDFDPHRDEMDRIIHAWLPLTFAVNSINRSMGQPDLYPFVLPPPVIVKLTFIHERIHRAQSPNSALRAMIAGLKRTGGTPNAR